MRKLVLLLLVAVAPALLAQEYFFRIDPPQPREGDAVEIHIGGDWAYPEGPAHPRLSIDGKTFTVDLTSRRIIPLLIGDRWGERIDLGRLDDGTYTFVVRIDGDEYRGHTFTVAPRSFRVAPSFGEAHTPVLIEGVPLDGCREPSCVRVEFGHVPALAVEIADGRIIATAPEGVSGTVDIDILVGANASLMRHTERNAFHFGVVDADVAMERVLVPVNYFGRGLHGSEWSTEITVRNDGPVAIETVPLFWTDPAIPVLQNPTSIPPGRSGYFSERPGQSGVFLRVPRGLEKHLSYSLHVVDRSRSLFDRGTEVPVVHAEDTASVVRILNVPTGGRFRAKLRIYHFDPFNLDDVVIELRRPEGGDPIVLSTALTGAPVCPADRCIADRPAFAAIDLPRIEGSPVDVTIRAQTNDIRLWGFVSVTNDETQHVTVYTPQHAGRGQ